jgi:hypothetical protein
MRAFRNYIPPSPAALANLKADTGFTGNQLADLLGLADGRQWRKYTGGADPRTMSPAMLFALATRLEIDDATLDRIVARMRAIGASLDFLDPEEAPK